MKYSRKAKRALKKQMQSNIVTIEREINRYNQPLRDIQGIYFGMLLELENEDVDEQFMERQTARIQKLTAKVNKQCV